MFVLHVCSVMLLIYSNCHHNNFCSYKFSFLQIPKSVLASTFFTSLCAFLFHPVFAAFSLFLPFFTFFGWMYVYARSQSSGRGSNIGIKALTSYRLNKIKFLWIFWIIVKIQWNCIHMSKFKQNLISMVKFKREWKIEIERSLIEI